MHEPNLLIHSASQLLTIAGDVQRGHTLGNLNILEDGAVAMSNGIILDVGPSKKLLQRHGDMKSLDAANHVVMPGFVDPHTHLVWAGDRAMEFERRIEGASYMEIMAAGGGINSTVRETRAVSLADLIEQSRPRCRKALQHGTTTIEVKTGYGLETETEIRMLQAILALDQDEPIDIVPTFLGAHAIPDELQNFPSEHAADLYTELVCQEMLPAVYDWWKQNSAERELPFVDVFCEEGAFSLDQSRKILEKADALGFPLKIHADEFVSLGGVKLAVDLKAVSADHLLTTPKSELKALSVSNTVAVALPATPFGLAENQYTPTKTIFKEGGILALATDLNPGTAWCESMQMTIALACRYMELTPAQAIAAATINAAAAINRSESIGSIETGKQADLIVIDAPDYRHLGYRFGTNLVHTVIKKGRVVYNRSTEVLNGKSG